MRCGLKPCEVSLATNAAAREGDFLAQAAADAVARRSYGKLVAFLAARTGDVAGAEDSLSEAFAAALESWPQQGCPENPEAWLLTVARRKSIDALRRNGRIDDDADLINLASAPEALRRFRIAGWHCCLPARIPPSTLRFVRH